ncbi:MAG TPA: zf-HC2 domain-containing protein [Gaiellaceae bacterium]
MTIGLAHLNCRELVELVTAYLEGDLSSGERKRFDAHLSACDGCTMYVEQMRRTIELTGTLRVDNVSREAEEALRHAFRDWKGR